MLTRTGAHHQGTARLGIGLLTALLVAGMAAAAHAAQARRHAQSEAESAVATVCRELRKAARQGRRDPSAWGTVLDSRGGSLLWTNPGVLLQPTVQYRSGRFARLWEDPNEPEVMLARGLQTMERCLKCATVGTWRDVRLPRDEDHAFAAGWIITHESAQPLTGYLRATRAEHAGPAVARAVREVDAKGIRIAFIAVDGMDVCEVYLARTRNGWRVRHFICYDRFSA
ncbi:MAG: hypothetical protein HY321_12830 [Armatimonadetes bacterium]|nr:hypothetical protein [Armatimonadota bacterium]